MKLTVTDKALFDGVQKAFQDRQVFTLTGAGLTAQYVAQELMANPFGRSWPGQPGPHMELTLTQISTVPWNGEGLPPVGLEVEVLWSSHRGTYVRGKVVAHDDGRAVFRFLDGERAGEYQAERVSTYNDGKLTNFRPIRTAEQIAAEERSEALQDLALLIDTAHGNDKTFAEVIYDAGYRKA